MGLVIFIFEMIEEFVKRIDKDDIDLEFGTEREEFGAELVAGESDAAKVPDEESVFSEGQIANAADFRESVLDVIIFEFEINIKDTCWAGFKAEPRGAGGKGESEVALEPGFECFGTAGEKYPAAAIQQIRDQRFRFFHRHLFETEILEREG